MQKLLPKRPHDTKKEYTLRRNGLPSIRTRKIKALINDI